MGEDGGKRKQETTTASKVQREAAAANISMRKWLQHVKASFLSLRDSSVTLEASVTNAADDPSTVEPMMTAAAMNIIKDVSLDKLLNDLALYTASLGDIEISMGVTLQFDLLSLSALVPVNLATSENLLVGHLFSTTV
uniref:Uncharacterized protein n=1 Tax=Zea mays TaxID=4577 RepID=A0A804U6V9_MAIZE